MPDLILQSSHIVPCGYVTGLPGYRAGGSGSHRQTILAFRIHCRVFARAWAWHSYGSPRDGAQWISDPLVNVNHSQLSISFSSPFSTISAYYGPLHSFYVPFEQWMA
jgi:hypothetical protein